MNEEAISMTVCEQAECASRQEQGPQRWWWWRRVSGAQGKSSTTTHRIQRSLHPARLKVHRRLH